jgi:hypothetical protein
MTIDDELILELIKPNSIGKIGSNAPILDIVGEREKETLYTLEESTQYTMTYGSRHANQVDIVKMTPDIVLAKTPTYQTPEGRTIKISHEDLITAYGHNIAIELENDIQWDFQSSLRKLKKYKYNFPDTRIIIPKDYERFAPLYKNEGFRVYLWKAARRWQCLRCGAETEKEGPVTPKCKNCQNSSQNDFRLVGLQDTNIEEFT